MVEAKDSFGNIKRSSIYSFKTLEMNIVPPNYNAEKVDDAASIEGKLVIASKLGSYEYIYLLDYYSGFSLIDSYEIQISGNIYTSVSDRYIGGYNLDSNVGFVMNYKTNDIIFQLNGLKVMDIDVKNGNLLIAGSLNGKPYLKIGENDSTIKGMERGVVNFVKFNDDLLIGGSGDGKGWIKEGDSSPIFIEGYEFFDAVKVKGNYIAVGSKGNKASIVKIERDGSYEEHEIGIGTLRSISPIDESHLLVAGDLNGKFCAIIVSDSGEVLWSKNDIGNGESVKIVDLGDAKVVVGNSDGKLQLIYFK